MTQPGQNPVDMARLVEELRLIGHPMRLELLAILARGERGVGELVADTGQGPVLVSQQLALLRKAGLVQTRREAKQVFYRLADGRLAHIMASLSQIVGPAHSPVSRSPVVAPISRGISAAMFARVEPRA
jgi:DNA-binding transcriptional ArsR family regulator